MAKLVIELQKDCLNPTLSYANLFQKAYFIAQKIEQKEMVEFLKNEINGYKNIDNLPDFRYVDLTYKAFNPMRGWIPFKIPSTGIYSKLLKGPIFLSVGEMQKFLDAEELNDGEVLLFHGAKSIIDGEVRTDASRNNNDFGQGFYMGETFRQAALFVSNFESSCVYAIKFHDRHLAKAVFSVNTEWMLTVACFRGRLSGRISKDRLNQICKKAQEADYIIAPIADNRMYQIIDSFIDGEIKVSCELKPRSSH